LPSATAPFFISGKHRDRIRPAAGERRASGRPPVNLGYRAERRRRLRSNGSGRRHVQSSSIYSSKIMPISCQYLRVHNENTKLSVEVKVTASQAHGHSPDQKEGTSRWLAPPLVLRWNNSADMAETAMSSILSSRGCHSADMPETAASKAAACCSEPAWAASRGASRRRLVEAEGRQHLREKYGQRLRE
jgi:hypothetical protein